MTKDEKKKLVEEISSSFYNSIRGNSKIQRIITDGAASSEEVAKLAKQLGAYLHSAVVHGFTDIELLEGEEMSELAKEILEPLMKYSHELVGKAAKDVYTAFNEENNIDINPKLPDFPKARFDQIISAAGEEDKPRETILRRISVVPETVVTNMSDNNTRACARVYSSAGFEAYITRSAAKGCCEWCSKMFGKFEYPKNTPKDIFRRHDNCECIVTYSCGSMRQNVHSRETWEQTNAEAPELVKNPDVTVPELGRNPDVKVPELRRGLLTEQKNGGIIESLSYQQDFMDREHREKLSRYVYDPKTGEQVREEWSFRTNPLGDYHNIFSQTYSENARAMAEYLNEKVNNGDYGEIDRIIIAKNKDLKGISSYRHTDNTFFISEELITQEGFDRLVNKSYFPARNLDDVITHELDGHKRHWDIVKKFYSDNLDKYSSLEDAKQDFERELREYIVNQQFSDYHYISKNVSKNAEEAFIRKNLLNELFADCSVIAKHESISDELLFGIIRELLKYDG